MKICSDIGFPLGFLVPENGGGNGPNFLNGNGAEGTSRTMVAPPVGQNSANASSVYSSKPVKTIFQYISSKA